MLLLLALTLVALRRRVVRVGSRLKAMAGSSGASTLMDYALTDAPDRDSNHRADEARSPSFPCLIPQAAAASVDEPPQSVSRGRRSGLRARVGAGEERGTSGAKEAAAAPACNEAGNVRAKVTALLAPQRRRTDPTDDLRCAAPRGGRFEVRTAGPRLKPARLPPLGRATSVGDGGKGAQQTSATLDVGGKGPSAAATEASPSSATSDRRRRTRHRPRRDAPSNSVTARLASITTARYGAHAVGAPGSAAAIFSSWERTSETHESSGAWCEGSDASSSIAAPLPHDCDVSSGGGGQRASALEVVVSPPPSPPTEPGKLGGLQEGSGAEGEGSVSVVTSESSRWTGRRAAGCATVSEHRTFTLSLSRPSFSCYRRATLAGADRGALEPRGNYDQGPDPARVLPGHLPTLASGPADG